MYATVAELRRLSPLGDARVYSDADLATAERYARELIDRYCGTSFGDVEDPRYKAFESVVSGNGSHILRLIDQDERTVLFPRSISYLTINGQVVHGFDIMCHSTGRVERLDGYFPARRGGHNIVLRGTAGYSTQPPEDIRWAARSIASSWLTQLHSRVPDRALSLTSSDGTYEVRAQAGAPGRPTNLPDVNAVLNRHRHYMPLG